MELTENVPFRPTVSCGGAGRSDAERAGATVRTVTLEVVENPSVSVTWTLTE